jgi:hypothetical protein
MQMPKQQHAAFHQAFTCGFRTWTAISLLALGAGCSSSSGGGDPPADSSGGKGGNAPNTGGSKAGGSGGTSAGTGGSAPATGGSGPATGGSGPSGGGISGGGTGGGSGTGGSGDGGSGGQTQPDASMPVDVAALPKFSFFVTSVDIMRKLSGNQNGFGGDLRFGKPDGLSGADEICRQAAEAGMKGAGAKPWHAFLSTAAGGANGAGVNAIDRVGEGPWYDRLGRLVAMNKVDLIQVRPRGAAAAIINDLPNENGVPNHAPDPDKGQVDNHDILTGSNATGTLFSKTATCADWTSTDKAAGRPRCGHSWPRGTQSWISVLDEAGCGAGINLVEMGGPKLSDPTVGSGGGYGGIYCLSTVP